MTADLAAPTTLGLVHFLRHTDAVGLGLFALLIMMSVLSWVLIVGRLRRAALSRYRNRRFLQAFGNAAESTARAGVIDAHLRQTPLARLAAACLAADHTAQHQLDDEVTTLEAGQAALASIASSAPFVGLFGTVWGIHHALLAIAASGRSSLDQVAGPIGEALIMTACGLAVAIPAGLAYNAFQRAIRLQIAQLEQFADRCLRQAETGA